MADYYSVITRAVSNLPSQTVEARWAIYDDACTALQEKLLALDPPISEDELANEQLALEAAIRKVEEEWLWQERISIVLLAFSIIIQGGVAF